MTHSKSDVDGNHCGITQIGLVSLSPPYCLVGYLRVMKEYKSSKKLAISCFGQSVEVFHWSPKSTMNTRQAFVVSAMHF